MRLTLYPHDLLDLSFTRRDVAFLPPSRKPPPLLRATPPPTYSVCCTPPPFNCSLSICPRLCDSPFLTCYRRAPYSQTASYYYPLTRLMHIPLLDPYLPHPSLCVLVICRQVYHSLYRRASPFIFPPHPPLSRRSPLPRPLEFRPQR